jgi:hypothetical protein
MGHGNGCVLVRVRRVGVLWGQAMSKDEDAFKRKLDEVAAQVNAGSNPFVGIHVVSQQMREAGFSMLEACTIIGVWIAYQAGMGGDQK